MDGPTPLPLQQVTKLKEHTWQVKFHGYKQNDPDLRIVIHIIDPINKVAVWEDLNAPVKYRYSLYVAVDKAKNFDLVVNYCQQNKTEEFNFDMVNYGLLLKKH